MAMSPTDHDELREQAELYVLGALASSDRQTFEAHLASCAECRAQVTALSPVAQALAYVAPQHDPPSELRARVLASITGTPGTAPASSTRPEGANVDSAVAGGRGVAGAGRGTRPVFREPSIANRRARAAVAGSDRAGVSGRPADG